MQNDNKRRIRREIKSARKMTKRGEGHAREGMKRRVRELTRELQATQNKGQ